MNEIFTKPFPLFRRDYSTGEPVAHDAYVHQAIWVKWGQGTATRKHDGIPCLVRDGLLYKVTRVGRIGTAWKAVGKGEEDRRHREAWAAWDHCAGFRPSDGTYELCGPKVNGNPEKYRKHMLLRHGCEVLPDAPRTFNEIRDYLRERDFDGIVWHHPDGRKAMVTASEMGLPKRGTQ